MKTLIYTKVQGELKRWMFDDFLEHKDAVASLEAVGVMTKPVMLVYEID